MPLHPSEGHSQTLGFKTHLNILVQLARPWHKATVYSCILHSLCGIQGVAVITTADKEQTVLMAHLWKELNTSAALWLWMSFNSWMYTPSVHKREAGSNAHRTWTRQKHTLVPQNNSVCLQFQQPSVTFPLSRAILALTSPTAASMNLKKSPLSFTSQVHPPWTHPFLPLKSTYTFDLQHILPRDLITPCMKRHWVRMSH